jgi:hypothetical protein
MLKLNDKEIIKNRDYIIGKERYNKDRRLIQIR